MKKSIYYKTVFQRKNVIKDFLLKLFLSIASYPRMILEVFIRKNFGERYFSFATAITIFVILLLIPALSSRYYFNDFRFDGWDMLMENKLWYIFACAFLYVANQRRLEIERLPSVFDFARFSLSNGIIHPFFQKLVLDKSNYTIRQIEIFIEPLVFLAIGLLLAPMGQAPLSILLVVCSIIYSLSYSAAYYLGDQFIMDKIDEMIASEEMVNAFVNDLDPSQTRGFNFIGRKPASPERRRQMCDDMVSDDDDEALAV